MSERSKEHASKACEVFSLREFESLFNRPMGFRAFPGVPFFMRFSAFLPCRRNSSALFFRTTKHRKGLQATTSGTPIKPPLRRRSETVIVRRQEKGDEKHGDRGCGKLEKTERSDRLLHRSNRNDGLTRRALDAPQRRDSVRACSRRFWKSATRRFQGAGATSTFLPT